MPIAVLSCQPSFAKSSTATTVVRSRWSNSKVQSSSHPYYNLNYIEFQKGSTYYSGKNYTTNNFPDEPTRCTINSISIGFRGVTVNSSGNGSTSYIPTIQVEGYDSSGVSTGSLTITSTMFTGDNSAATGNKLRIFSFTSGLPTNWLNKDNLYTIKFIVTGHFSLWGTDSDGAVSNFTITIDYTEPPKPSFTNAPVLKVNNNDTSSVDNTAVLTWTQASLDSNFSNLQSSVKYEVWVNDSKYSDAGTNLTFTYLEQSSSRKAIKVRAYLVSSGITYYSNYSNAVYYTYIPSGYVATKVIDDGRALDPNWTGETDPNSQSTVYYFYSGDTLWVNTKSTIEGVYGNIYHLAYNSLGQVGYVSLYYLDWALNTLKYYDNGWKDCYIYYYNGSNWIPCMAYYYTGTEWKQCQ